MNIVRTYLSLEEWCHYGVSHQPHYDWVEKIHQMVYTMLILLMRLKLRIFLTTLDLLKSVPYDLQG